MGYVVRVHSTETVAYYVDCDTAEEAEQGYAVDGRVCNAMELKLQVLADVVMDEEALEKMLGEMSFRELEYLQSKITATLSRASVSYASGMAE